ncbi:MAG: ATP-binding protein, partial [Pseudanabaena sp. ELA748]
IDPEDAQYTDILLSCTRHLLEELKNADPAPILGWLGDRWQDLKDLALTKISFEKLSVEAQISEFAKLTASIRAIPSERQKIRELVNPHTITLLKALNEFIDDAKRKLPKDKTHLVAIADNLDRIVPIPQEHGRTNHDEIFLDRAQQLQGLNCHIIYTIPISMVYSSRAADLRDIYGDPQVLPMIMVQTPNGETDAAGLAKITEIIKKRIEPFAPNANLETAIFSSAEGLLRLCLMSGGHVRNLMLLVRSAIDHIDSLPITEKAIQRGITQARDTYRRTVEQDEWELLAKVTESKQIDNDDRYRKLLFNRCVLQYGYFDDEGELQPWYDVHPLIKGIQQFKDAVAQLKQNSIIVS